MPLYASSSDSRIALTSLCRPLRGVSLSRKSTAVTRLSMTRFSCGVIGYSPFRLAPAMRPGRLVLSAHRSQGCLKAGKLREYFPELGGIDAVYHVNDFDVGSPDVVEEDVVKV